MISELIRSWIKKNCSRWLHDEGGFKVEFGITGTVTLSNLHMRTEELNILQLPLECKHLFIERIHFDIPLSGGILGKLLIEAGGIYMVASTQQGGSKVTPDPLTSRLALQALVHLCSMTMARLFTELWAPKNSASTLLGTSAMLGLKAMKVARGVSAGVALRTFVSILQAAKISLKNIHIRVEDKGEAGPRSLQWEGLPMATGILVSTLEIRKSDQPADSKFPELPEWDVEKAEGTAAIDCTFTTKGLTIYWEDLEQKEGMHLKVLQELPLNEALAELRKPFSRERNSSSVVEDGGDDRATSSIGNCVIDDSMICLLENVEISLRVYVQVNMGVSMSAELFSLPWRIVALRAQLLAPVINLSITEEQIKITLRIMALIQGYVRTLQKGAMLPSRSGKSFRNIARERWAMIRAAIDRDAMRRCVYDDKSLTSAQVWRGFFRIWRLAARYMGIRRILRATRSGYMSLHTFTDSAGLKHVRFFEGNVGQMKGCGAIPVLEEGIYDHEELISKEDQEAAREILRKHLQNTITEHDEGNNISLNVQRALYAMQLHLDSVMPPRVTAACRLLEHMRHGVANTLNTRAANLFPFLGCLLVMVADVTGIRPIIANAGLDAYCDIQLTADNAPSQNKTTDIATFHAKELRATWGQILPLACPVSAEDGPNFTLKISCMDKGMVMDHNIGSGTLLREAVTAQPNEILEHNLELSTSSSGSSASSNATGGGNTRIRLFTVWIPEGCEGSTASKAKDDLVNLIHKISKDTLHPHQQQQQHIIRSQWDLWSIPEADLCVDIGMLKIIISTTVRRSSASLQMEDVRMIDLEPAVIMQMHQASLYTHAGASSDSALHDGRIWTTSTAQLDLLRLLVLPRPASAGLTASPLDVKLGPLTLSSDFSPDAIRNALSTIGRDKLSKMKPHDVLIFLATNTAMRLGIEFGTYRALLSSMGKIFPEVFPIFLHSNTLKITSKVS